VSAVGAERGLVARRRGREDDVAILAVALVVIAAAWMLDVTPAQDGVSLFGLQLPEVCGARRWGGECPGCGLTRSFVLGVRGDLEAFRLHPGGPLLLLLLVSQVPLRGARLLLGRGLDGPVSPGRARRWGILVWVAIGVCVVGGWLIKVWLR